MSLTPLALSAGARLGSWGLRQGKDIIIPLSTNIEFTNSLQVYFYSPSGEVIAALSAGLGDGKKLDLKWTEEKYGGLKSFTIIMLKDLTIPFFNGMLIRFFMFNNPWALGFIRGIPDTDTDSETIELKGVGYVEKLKDIVVSKTYTNVTPFEIIDDISQYFSDVDINYNATKVILPNFNITKLIFDDKSLFSIIETVLRITNYQYQELQQVFGVDELQEFYFIGIEKANIKSHYFEGYNYQSPEVETNINKIVNQVPVFRTQEASEKETEFVASYNDTDSIDNYGLFERKLTVSDFVDDTEAQKIAEAIITENKDPRKRVTIQNLELTKKLLWGFYGLSNKRRFQRNILSEFSDLSEWSQALTTSILSIQDTAVFTGRRCFKWTIDNSSGDKISLSFDRIYGPEKAIIYLRHSAKIEALKITFTAKIGATVGKLITSADDSMEFSDATVISLHLKDFDHLEGNIDNLFINDWIPYTFNFNDVFWISDVEIEVITSGTVDVLLDSLNVYTNSYKYNNLALENIEYNFNGKSIKASATFGNNEDTIISELQKINKKNKIPFEIFSKQ